MFYVGVPMGYGSVKTLTDNSVRNCVGDMRAFQPTIMVGVPAVWELIRKGINAKVAAGGAVKSKVFHGALAAKKASPSLLGPVTDALVFKAVKQATGGKLKYALSGGAMISKETHEFLRLALTNLIQGYGACRSFHFSGVSNDQLMLLLVSSRYDRVLRVRKGRDLYTDEAISVLTVNPLHQRQHVWYVQLSTSSLTLWIQFLIIPALLSHSASCHGQTGERRHSCALH